MSDQELVNEQDCSKVPFGSVKVRVLFLKGLVLTMHKVPE